AARYDELLRGADVETPPADDADHERSWFVYVVKLPAGVDRDGVIARLADDGVASAPYLPSIHLQPYMRERFGFAEGLCPVSEDCSARTMAIPFHARLEGEDQAYGAVAVAMFVTYSTVDPEQLYHVSGHGFAGGLSRVLVYANFPVALVAAPLAVLGALRIGTRAAHTAAGASVALCAVVVVPGV